MKKFFRNSEATFSCVEQAQAMMEVMGRQNDLLVIMPTESGKSLLFMLPTLIEHGMTTVVLIPLVALGADMKDMKARCNKAGIRWAEWQGTDLLKR